MRTSNPEWTDENGTPLQVRISAVEAKGFAGLRQSPAFGIKAFTPEQSHEFEQALQVDTSYDLYEELMVDARDALMQGNLRRGVLEMAIACEVATKELFAKKGEELGPIYPWLYIQVRKRLLAQASSKIIRKIGIISNIFSNAGMTLPTEALQVTRIRTKILRIWILTACETGGTL